MKGIKAYTTENLQTIQEENKRRNKGISKQPENNEQNSNSKSTPINNYYKYKWTKFSNQKTHNG